MTETGQLTRSLVLVALSLASGVMLLVSLRGNFLFGASLGQSEEKRLLFGWANVGADVWKAFGLIAVSKLWRAKHRRACVAASLAWLMCLFFGMNSALGIYVQDRAALTGNRQATYTTYREAEHQLGGVEQRLRERGTHRSTAEIDAAIETILSRAVVAGERLRGTVAAVSQNCSKIDLRTSGACAEIAQLREERAAAVETAKLEERASALRAQIATLRGRGGSLSPDPVGEFYAWITRGLVSVRDVGFGFPLFFALLVEVVSAFGPLTVAAYAEATRASNGMANPALSGPDALRHAMAGYGEPEDGSVMRWVAARAVPVAGNRAISIDDLHADYALWCADNALRAAPTALFEAEFDRVRGLPELAGKIRKFGDRYYGIGLVRSRNAVLSGRGG